MEPDQASAQPSRGETIEELFAALEGPLLAYTLRLVREREAAEDIVQEAFMRLHEQFDEVREPRRWLYRTAHNLAINELRKGSRIVPLEPRAANEGESGTASEPADPQPLPDEQIARIEGIGLVRLSLETLEPRSRQLLQLKFTEGLSYKEMSERTGLSVGNVGFILHHALKAIADELARNGVKL
jgi:RNA polymerase sigma-70 factor (ECF subfamily)